MRVQGLKERRDEGLRARPPPQASSTGRRAGGTSRRVGFQFWGFHSSVKAVLTSQLHKQHLVPAADLGGGTRAEEKPRAGIQEPEGENRPSS